MNKSTCTIIIGVLAAATAAATSKPLLHLTLQRVLELTAPAAVPAVRNYRIEISDLGQAILPSDKPEGQITVLQEMVSPTDFNPPQSVLGGPVAIVPSVPTNFETLKTGWTVRLSVKPLGKLVAVSGVADFAEASLVPAGYGAVAGPIYTDKAPTILLTPNVMNMARVQTTTTRFQVFAVPGEGYEVTFYRGEKTEKHRVSLFAD